MNMSYRSSELNKKFNNQDNLEYFVLILQPFYFNFQTHKSVGENYNQNAY